MSEWVPATEAELAMRGALRAGDQELYFRILARIELLLPVSADALAGRAPIGWGTWTSADRTHVLAFTSPEAMAACLAEHAGSARKIAYHQLAQTWPNLEWWLAVNPGLPIEAYLPAWFVTQLSRGDVRLPGRPGGARARSERIEGLQRARAVATVPAALPAGASSGSASGSAAVPSASEPAGSPGSGSASSLAGSASGSVGSASGSVGSASGSAAVAQVAPASLGSASVGIAPVSPASVGIAPLSPAGGAAAAVPPAGSAASAVPAASAAPPLLPRPTAHVPQPSAPTAPPYVSAALAPPARGQAAADAFAPPARGQAAADGLAPSARGQAAAPLVDERPTEQRPVDGRPSELERRHSEFDRRPSDDRPGDDYPGDRPSGDRRLTDGRLTDWVGSRQRASAATPLAAAPLGAPPLVPPATPAAAPATPAASLAPPTSPTVPPTGPTPPLVPSKGPAPLEASPISPAPAPTAPAPPAQSGPRHAEPAGPAFDPANDVEANLYTAAEEGDTDAFLSTLLLAKVLVPLAPGATVEAQPGDDDFRWLTDTLEDHPYVVVFTSQERIVDHLGAPVDTTRVKFVQLIRHWPDPEWSFAVNPGTPVGAKLPGAQIVALASWADEVGLSGDHTGDLSGEHSGELPVAAKPTGSAPAEAGPTMMQKLIPPGQVDYYLDRGYDRISGFVHRASEVAHLRTPGELFTALGLHYTGSPFANDATEAHVLRWAAHRPNLYRIPYGGQHEAGMRAMQGWVIERPPFRGNGFAPGDSSDIIAEFKVDSARLPHGAQLWRMTATGIETLVAMLDADGPQWRRVLAEV